MAELLAFVMLLAATLYAVLGGADFGVGIVEPLLSKEQAARIDEAISPVWEANHVWLVLLVVLAFVGFPGLFSALTITLHIPLALALLGIVARGTAFTFRHYDPEPGALRVWYSWAFRLGSMLTPLFLGISAAACVEGNLTLTGRDVYATYVAPWNTPFCWTSGLFVCALFAFEGVALLAAEQARAEGPLPLLRTARLLHLVAIVLGGVALLCAYFSPTSSLRDFLFEPRTLGCLALATLLIPLVAHAFKTGRPWLLRVSVGGQVAAVLGGLFAASYPHVLRLKHGALSLPSVAAPESTLRTLGIAVAIGLALIVPAMIYLLRVYKLAPKETP